MRPRPDGFILRDTITPGRRTVREYRNADGFRRWALYEYQGHGAMKAARLGTAYHHHETCTFLRRAEPNSLPDSCARCKDWFKSQVRPVGELPRDGKA